MKMNQEQIEKKQFDVKTIIDDVVVSLCMQGLTRQASLDLLMIQASIRMDSAARVRSILKSISDMLIDDDDDDEDDDVCR